MSMALERLRCWGWAVLLAASAASGGPAAADQADQCLEQEQVVERLLCLVDAAKRAGDVEVCQRAEHEGVRWQCVAIFAEYRRDASLCRTIPRGNQDYRELFDVCLSDVAEARGEPELCGEIGTDGLRDSCYLKLVRAGASAVLCARIRDPGLKSACAGEPADGR